MLFSADISVFSDGNEGRQKVKRIKKEKNETNASRFFSTSVYRLLLLNELIKSLILFDNPPFNFF